MTPFVCGKLLGPTPTVPAQPRCRCFQAAAGSAASVPSSGPATPALPPRPRRRPVGIIILGPSVSWSNSGQIVASNVVAKPERFQDEGSAK